MKCLLCDTKVLNNSDYSQHMNKMHRGKSYKSLPDLKVLTDTKEKDSYKAKGKGNYGFDR